MPTWMVVEDEPDVYDVLLAMFEIWGIEGVAFVDGREAADWIEAVDQGDVRGDLPELAVLDIRLPEVDGPEVGHRIRRSPKLRNMAIALITAYRMNPEEEERVIQHADADLLMYKPLPQMAELREILDRIVARHRPAVELQRRLSPQGFPRVVSPQASARTVPKDHTLRNIVLGLFAVFLFTTLGLVIFSDKMGLLANIFTELLGMLLTIFVIDLLIGRRQAKLEETHRKEKLIITLCSSVNDEAKRAAEELRRLGYLFDGSLREISLAQANLDGVRLTGANLQGVDLSEASIRHASLGSVNLESAMLYKTRLNATNLSKSNLRNAYLASADLEAADLTFCHFEGANLRNATLKNARLDHAQFDDSTVLPDGSFWNPAVRLSDLAK
jgi:CheY-like chemotaxis protein